MEGQLIIAQAEVPEAPAPIEPGAPAAPLVDTPPLEPGGEELHTEVGAEEHGATFPPFDPTFFASQLLWLAITFVAFYLIMQRVALPRIGAILEVRRDRIAGDLDRAEQLKRESDAAIAAYEKSLADARSKAFAIAEDSRKKASAAAEEQRRENETALASRLAAAEGQIAAIKEKALAEVGTIAGDVAGTVVESLIGKRATADEIRAAVTAAGDR
ncbi:MAG: F0F1 ATP synthase subunit B [Bauldia sp.]|nr:F0F1 ATP synthase subunit B [Bauldia sp.]